MYDYLDLQKEVEQLKQQIKLTRQRIVQIRDKNTESHNEYRLWIEQNERLKTDNYVNQKTLEDQTRERDNLIDEIDSLSNHRTQLQTDHQDIWAYNVKMKKIMKEMRKTLQGTLTDIKNLKQENESLRFKQSKLGSYVSKKRDIRNKIHDKMKTEMSLIRELI